MKQNLHYFFSILLTIILLSPPAAVWADAPKVGDSNTDYFTITNVSESQGKIYIYRSQTTKARKIDYSTDGGNNWSTLQIGGTGTGSNSYFTINAGASVKFKVNTTWEHSTSDYIYFKNYTGSNGQTWALSGDLMTLVSSTYVASVPTYSFYSLFKGVTHLQSISGLKLSSTVTSLEQGALESMFQNCYHMTGSTLDLSNITGTVGLAAFKKTFYCCSTCTTISSLPPADTIGASGCYQMFYGCSSISTIPENLFNEARIGKEGCYQMFQGCTSLTSIPNLNATRVWGGGCKQMFQGCTGLRDCSSAHLKANRVEGWGYYAMFLNCSEDDSKGITHAPQIDATSMGVGACDSMFLNCSTLVYPPQALHPTSLPSRACKSMFWNCNALTKFPVIKATTVSNSSAGGTFATFYKINNSKATNVHELEVRFTEWGSYAQNQWVFSVPNTGTFICSASLDVSTFGDSKVPKSSTYKWDILFYPKITFRVWKDSDGNPTGGQWSETETDTLPRAGDWYGDEPFPTPVNKDEQSQFKEWVDKDGNAVSEDDPKVARNENSAKVITLYAKFTDSEYTLTWDFAGGTTATAEEDYSHGMLEAGAAIVAPANPTKNGYAFAGWDVTPASTMPAANTTYTAQWTAINYTFDVATNGGTWSDASTADSVRTVSGITALTTPQKDKFTFERWNTSADGTGTDMDASALPTTATKYYAIFIKVDYFRFIAQNATTTISTTKYGSETAPSLSYSTDNGATWNTFTIGTTSVELKAGDSVCFRGVNANGLNRNCKGDSFKKQPASPYWYFTSTDSVSVAGNIMTLVQGTNPTNTIPAYNCFAAIMKGMPLVSAAKLQLPSSTHNGCYKYMFYNSSIRIAPELPALHVADSAYQGMFSNCQSLKIAPEIPATTVGVASMRNMFYDCWELTQAPSELKATQIYAYTYRGMFWTCKKLQTSPVIRATTMPTPGNSDVAAMGLMFRNCSTLVNVSVRMKTWNYVSSELSAAYYWLSYGSSTGTLTCPSALPTATRNNQTFPSGWTVNYIPELTFDVNTNGGTWEDESTTARVLESETTWTIPTDVTAPANRTFVGWNTEADGTGDWLTVDNQPVISTTAVIRTYYAIYAMNLTFNVATAGATWDGSANENRTYTDVQFRRGEIPSPQRGDIEVCSAWVTAGGDTLKSNSVLTPGTVYSPLFAEYVCITAQTDNVGVGISSIGTGSTITFNLYYSTDGMNWKKASGSPFKTINTGEKLYLRGTNANGINTTANGAAYTSNHYIKFNITNNATLSGNLMTLIHPTNPPTTIPGAYCFAKLFKNDTGTSSRYCKITDASRLKMPATTMLESCYEGMFHDCNLLVNGPKLVATTLAANCYKQLFYNCSALRRIEVAFDDWSDDGSGNPAYTNQWMSGTTTDANANARFIGPAVLFEHVRNNGHIQLNWKGMDFELLDDQDDAYYTALKDMDGIALQQVTFKGTFPAKRWITFNVPFDFFIPEDHPFADHVYEFLGADGNATEGFDIHFQGNVFKLEAGMPYLYYGDETLTDFVFAADGENNTILTIDADALEAESVWPTYPEINTSGAEYRSTVKMTPLPGGDKHYIFISGNRLYYPNSAGSTLYAFSGYFYVPSTGSIAPRVRMMVNGKETDMQIESFGAEEQTAEAGTKKYIQNSTLVIERNGVKYDAQGHKLN